MKNSSVGECDDAAWGSSSLQGPTDLAEHWAIAHHGGAWTNTYPGTYVPATQ